MKHHIYDHALGDDYNWTFQGLGSWFTDLRDATTGKAKQEAEAAKRRIAEEAERAKQQITQQATAVVQGAVQKVGTQAAGVIQSKVAQISANPLVQKYTGQAIDKSAASAIAEKIAPAVTVVRQNIKPIAIVAAIGIAYLILRKK